MARNEERTRHDLEDREPESTTTKFNNSGGETVEVDVSNPLPVTGTDEDTIRLSEIYMVGKDILTELKKLNKFAREAMDGDVL